jgi:hypothetical protein
MRKIFLFLLLFIFSCSKKKEVDTIELKDKTVVFFDPYSLGLTGIDADLKINASFSECGEWGGHYEDLKIFVKEKNRNDYFLNYIKTNVDCDKRDKNEKTLETVAIKKTIKLTDANKISIIEYMQRMVESKAEERFPGHAGDSFSIMNFDSTFVIKVYDYNSKNFKSYNQLLAELKLSGK